MRRDDDSEMWEKGDKRREKVNGTLEETVRLKNRDGWGAEAKEGAPGRQARQEKKGGQRQENKRERDVTEQEHTDKRTRNKKARQARLGDPQCLPKET